MATIEAISISKHYLPQDGTDGDPVEAVRDISLHIEDGELVTFFGPNACGKTTLLKLFAGLEQPDAGGSVEIGGKSPQKVRIGYVFQNYSDSLFPWKTALDNVAFPLLLSGLPRKESREKASDFLAELGVEIDKDAFPYKLSGGQQQTIAILRAFNYQPDLFVLDEPFSSLDFQARLEMRDHFLRIWSKAHKTTLFVSHEIDEALYLCDRLVMLTKRPGRIARIIKNKLPRPRQREMLNDPHFIELRKLAIETFMEEVPS